MYLDYMTPSDIVDTFYQELKEAQTKELETTAIYATPQAFHYHLQTLYVDQYAYNKIPLWHVVWKGKKKIGILYRINPETGEPEEVEVDESYVPDKELGETVEWLWVNEVYEGYRIGLKDYLRMQPIPIQRNALNNLSTCKLPYNGRRFSDTHSVNISVMEIGPSLS